MEYQERSRYLDKVLKIYQIYCIQRERECHELVMG
jgi:hypothetical protein